MFCMLKKMFKVGALATVVVGAAGLAAVAIAGESRTRAVVREVRTSVQTSIDRAIENPSALRAQLREMEKEYPEKIAQVRGDLSELQQEIRLLERERAICERVVALVEDDLGGLELELSAEVVPVSDTGLQPTWRRPSATATRVGQLQDQRALYQTRVGDADHSLLYMRQQETRLENLLTKLEAERVEFQGQIAGLSRQIDAIARNDRLIGLLEKRNRTIEECSRYEAVSLDQITGRLASIRSRQEAELDHLATSEAATDYEQAARRQIAAETMVREMDTSAAGLRTAQDL